MRLEAADELNQFNVRFPAAVEKFSAALRMKILNELIHFSFDDSTGRVNARECIDQKEDVLWSESSFDLSRVNLVF